jgi:hypothetical protein
MSTPTTFYLSSIEDVSCSALIFVDISAMQHMFKYATDVSDISNIAIDWDLKYYVNALPNSQLTALNPANIQVDPNPTSPNGGSPIASPNLVNGNSVADDFVRYLAQRSFNTYYGVKLFNDVSGLLQDLKNVCGLTGTPIAGTWNTGTDSLDTIWNSLNLYDATSPLYVSATSATITAIKAANNSLTMETDDLGMYYITNEHDTGETNLTRTLLQQMIASQNMRFSQIVNPFEALPLPFIVDDMLDFRIVIAAAPGQERLTGVTPIPPRSYRIQLKMKAPGTAGNAFAFSGTV